MEIEFFSYVTQRKGQFYVTYPKFYNLCEIFGNRTRISLTNWFIIMSFSYVEELQYLYIEMYSNILPVM